MADRVPLADACAEGIGALLGAAQCMDRMGYPEVGQALRGHARTLSEALLDHVCEQDISGVIAATTKAIEKAKRTA